MPTLDELLNDSNEVATCTVNPDTREIIVPEKYKILGVFSDEKVTKIPFTCPKVVGNNVDLTEYNLYINYQNAIGRHNAYLVDDVAVSGNNITFSWLLSRDVTLSSGVVKYSICAKKLNGDSISNEWNTTIANGVVIQGLEATQAIVEENPDIIEAILSKAHTHANKSVLDKFAETDGKPTYDGKTLGGSDASVTEANITSALGYKPVAPGDIPVVPTADISANTSARHSHANKDVLDSITAADKTKLNSVENGANKTIVDTAMSDTSTNSVQNKVIKKYIDDHSAGTGGTGGTANAVLYTAQTLDKAQQLQARKNIGAIGHDSPQFSGFLTLAPANAPLGTGVGLSPSGSGNDFTLDISDVNEGTPTLLTGVKTPNDTDTNAAATVEYVKAKVAGSSGSSSSSNILTSPVMICKPGEEGNSGIYLSTVDTGEKQAEIKLEDANENSAVAIANLRTPTGANASDYAATKGYVDSKVPTALKNPNALTIKIGSTTVTYDGSTAQTVTIADGSEVSY